MTDIIMDERFLQLKEAEQQLDRNNQISIPKIQRVPMFLRKNERFYKYCTPKFISFGPIHHRNEDLKEGEYYKLLWTSIFVAKYGEKINQDANQACKFLLKKIEDNIEEVKFMFDGDVIKNYNDIDLAWMLFVDGCSLLYFMKNCDDQCPETLNLKFDRLMYIVRDAILLENQLPSKMLQILCKESGLDLEYCYSNYRYLGLCNRIKAKIPLGYSMPLNILDSFRSIYLTSNLQDKMIQRKKMLEGSENNIEKVTIMVEEQDDIGEKQTLNWNTYKNIRDLKKIGIQVMPNENNKYAWSNISFKSKWFSGELRLPSFVFSDGTPYLFRNLAAFEMCPDVHYNYECCSFFSFMDSLIDSEEDVKELRLAGVFQNLLESDEELAKLFNELGGDLPTKTSCNFSSSTAVAYSKKYIRIKLQIEKHYTNKWKTWLAEGYNTHFNTPWTMIGFLAALLALILTFIQTWYAIHPK